MTDNPTKPNPFDPESLRVDGTLDTVGAERIFAQLPVRKPNKQEFFRVSPDEKYQLVCAVHENQEDGNFYIVGPAIVHELAADVKTVNLKLCINRQEALFLWPTPMPSADGRTNPWHKSARVAAANAEKCWVRMIANMSAGDYTLYAATGTIPEPQWPDKEMHDLLELAFGNDRMITDTEHPVVKQLRGL